MTRFDPSRTFRANDSLAPISGGKGAAEAAESASKRLIRSIGEPGGLLMESGGLASDSTGVLILEGDPGLRREFRSLVESEPDMEIVGETSSGKDAIDCVRQLAPDVVLLGVELPEMNGIQIVREYGIERFPTAIFIAGSDRYAAEAFQVNAFDYLVRPFTDERFHGALDRVRQHVRRNHLQDLSQRLGALLAEVRDVRTYPQHLWIRSRGQILVLDVDEIDWVEADVKYCRVHAGAATRRLHESMSHIESRLDPSRFARIHRSAIVNLNRVAEVHSSARSHSVILKNGTRIPMSRSEKLRVFELAGADG